MDVRAALSHLPDILQITESQVDVDLRDFL